jgi:hypothetical protein
MTVRRLLVSIAVGGVMLTSAQTIGASVFTYDRELSWWVVSSLETATIFGGSQVKRIPLRTYVRCYTDRQSFEDPLTRAGETSAAARGIVAYYDGKGYVHMRADTCRQARAFVSGRTTAETAGAFHTLLHETLHRQGLRNERITECLAVVTTKYAGWLVHWNRIQDSSERAWAASEKYGDRAMLLALRASRQRIASHYQTDPRLCVGVVGDIGSWADVLFGYALRRR